ncbi:MAG: hypothetical protein PVSMB4_12900 [Ktedonobacterales bacterium]
MRIPRWSQRRPLMFALVFCASLGSLAFSTPAMAATAAQPHTWHAVVGTESSEDAIQGMAFLPGTLFINVGDKIVWTVRAGEIHTVTFLATGQALPPFNPGDPKQLFPFGGSHYDGTTYHNSGILSDEGAASGFPAGQTYSLIFDVPGDFTYFCLVHGTMMQGLVHVRPAGTLYPFTQDQYNHQIASQGAALIRFGRRLWEQNDEKATNHLVFAGADGGAANVMRWINSHPKVHVGTSITFVNNGVAEPHTVTFGADQGNIFLPYGDPTHFTGQPLNSGIFLPGATFTVTFLKAGTFAFHCALHDYLGMAGTVVVDD